MSLLFANAGVANQHFQSEVNHERISIVIVDDSPYYLEVIGSLLECEGSFDIVEKANHGAEAVSAVQKLHPQLVLMDVNMPRMDGLQAAKLIAASFPEVKIALMSVDDSACTEEKCFACGAHTFIGKQHFRENFAVAVKEIFFSNVPPTAA